MSIDKIISTLPGKTDAERDRMRENANRQLASGKAELQANAKRFIAALDELIESERTERKAFLDGLPRAARVVEVFTALPATETEAKVIRALMSNPGSTSSQLSEACGWSAQSWNAHFGQMCQHRETWLWPAEPATTRDGNFYSSILADFDPETSTWKMKDDLAPAFQELGIAPRKAA